MRERFFNPTGEARVRAAAPRALFTWIALALAVFATPGVSAAERARPPNVVVLLLDNIGQEWFGCYGSQERSTPNIDRLAATGVRFANCYTSTVCAPSRVEFLTGRYPFRTGWYLHHDAGLYGGGGLDPRRETTVARLLQDAGYSTGIAGKWQVNNLYDEPDALVRHGFAESLVWPGSIDRDKVAPGFFKAYKHAIDENDAAFLQQATRNIESRYWDPVMLRNGKREVLKGRFGPDVFQEFAFDFLRRHRDRPFFFFHSIVLAHGASAADAIITTPENRAQPPASPHEAFAAMVRYADRQVAEFIAELERLGLRDNTIVFIASDNGTDGGLTARRDDREVKGGLYQINEAGSNVALLVSSPRLVHGGRVGALADFSDFLPTICEFAGVKPPATLTLDGRSLASYLRGESALPRTWIFNQYNPERVVRNARFKLYHDGRLFDVQTDPDEKFALAPGADSAADAARRELQAVLNLLPRDVAPPFEHRSLSAFRQRAATRNNGSN